MYFPVSPVSLAPANVRTLAKNCGFSRVLRDLNLRNGVAQVDNLAQEIVVTRRRCSCDQLTHRPGVAVQESERAIAAGNFAGGGRDIVLDSA